MEGADAEVHWVQCNDCDTWRIVPPSIDLNKLPNRWHCEMNTWDPKRASCSAADEVAPSASNHADGCSVAIETLYLIKGHQRSAVLLAADPSWPDQKRSVRVCAMAKKLLRGALERQVAAATEGKSVGERRTVRKKHWNYKWNLFYLLPLLLIQCLPPSYCHTD